MGEGHVVVRLNGGLGNQLFQYHLAAFLQLQGWRVRVDASEVRITHDHVGLKPIELDPGLPLRGLDLPLGIPDTAARVATVVWRNALLRTRRRLTDEWVRGVLDGGDWSIPRRALFTGNFQYHEIVDVVRSKNERLRAPRLLRPSPWFIRERAQVDSHDPWAIHVRRGDFDAHNGLLGVEYYADAFERLELDRGRPGLLFTDDSAAATALLAPLALHITPVQPEPGTPAAESMLLMASCSSVISSNSTFSWWAARWCTGPVAIPDAFDPRDEDYSHQRSVDLAFPGATRVPAMWE